MPRIARIAPGGIFYHVFNRANGRLRLFKKDSDFEIFGEILGEARERLSMRILDWTIMSNHWHLVLWPKKDGDLSAFMRWMTLTHSQRWKHSHAAVGQGHLYQGRFKSFPIQGDRHLLTVLRYVERNPLRAGLVKRAQDWRWGSCHVRDNRSHPLRPLLSDWPIDRPAGWNRIVNAPQTLAEEEAVQTSLKRCSPFGDVGWVRRIAGRLSLEQTLRPRGRPLGWRKPKAAGV